MIRFRDPHPPSRIGFTADGRHLVGFHANPPECHVTWWDWASTVVVSRVASDLVGISPDGGYVAARRRGRCEVRGWPGGELIGEFDMPGPLLGYAAIAPDGSEVVVPIGARVEVRDLATGAVRARPRAALFHAWYSPGGRWLIGNVPGTAVFLDRSARFERVGIPAADWTDGTAVGPDDVTAATVGRAVNAVVLRELPPGKEIRRLKGHKRSVKAVTFAPDGRRLLTGGSDGTTRVWDAATGGCVQMFDWRIGEVELVAWSPDGTTAAAANSTGDVVVWDIDG